MPYSRVGRSGWQFAKLPTSARMASMAGIATVLGRGDANAALTNPASMSDVSSLSMSGSSMNWIADITYYSGAVVKSFDQWGVFGFSINTLDYGDMVRTENQEQFGPSGETPGPHPTRAGRTGHVFRRRPRRGAELRPADHRPLAGWAAR